MYLGAPVDSLEPLSHFEEKLLDVPSVMQNLMATRVHTRHPRTLYHSPALDRGEELRAQSRFPDRIAVPSAARDQSHVEGIVSGTDPTSICGERQQRSSYLDEPVERQKSRDYAIQAPF
jgi:hypothetical protein